MKSVKCKVVHSQSKAAWNIVGEVLGCIHKIARIPYNANDGLGEILATKEKAEALHNAEFLCYCLNNADKIEIK